MRTEHKTSLKILTILGWILKPLVERGREETKTTMTPSLPPYRTSNQPASERK